MDQEMFRLFEIFRRPHIEIWLQPDRVFLVLALAFGLCIAVVTQPESGGDERDHFARAYQIALGEIFTVPNPSGAIGFGAMFPSGLASDLQILANVAYIDRNRTAFIRHLADTAPTGQPTWVDINNAASYGPGVYTPHIIGIEIGRVFNTSTLMRLYLARLCGLLAYVFLVTVAIRRTPWHPWVFAACGLLPSVLGQAATVNADALTIALSYFVTATILRMAASPATATRRQLLEIGITGVFMGLGKPPYMACIGLLAVPVWRHREQLLKPALAVIATTAALSLLWALYQAGHSIPQDDPHRWLGGNLGYGYAFHNIEPGHQLKYLITHPLSFAAAIARTFWVSGWQGFREMIGRMGTWLAPSTVVGGFLILLVLAARQHAQQSQPPLAQSQPTFDKVMRSWLLAVTSITGLAIFIIGYTNWNAYQALRIDALPPRYALPLLPAFLVAVLPASPSLSPLTSYTRRVALSIGIAVALLATAAIIFCWHLTGDPLFYRR